MAIIHNEKIYRNLEEQVLYNKEAIERILEHIREEDKNITMVRFVASNVEEEAGIKFICGTFYITYSDGTQTDFHAHLDPGLIEGDGINLNINNNRYEISVDQDLINQINNLTNSMDYINELIPEQADPENQLADKEFVNSSIATNTANFRGTYTSESALPTTGNTPNDYAFVQTTDNEGNTIYKRFKWVDGEWLFEYDLNNSSFTAQQWANINMDHSKFLEKKDTPSTIYGIGANKSQVLWNISTANYGNTIPIRMGTGTIVASDPNYDYELATKKYVDNGLSGITSDLDGKVDKVTTPLIVYGNGISGNFIAHPLTTDLTPWSVARRDGDGRIITATPASNNDAATKKYVDDAVDGLATEGYVDTKVASYDSRITNAENAASSAVSAVNNKLDKITSVNRLYATGSTGNQTSIGWSTAANADSVVVRLGDGRIKISDPVVWSDGANKNYVDNADAAVISQIPTKTSDLDNDSNYVVSSDLATVATSGSYNDLSNKPIIPEGLDNLPTILKSGTSTTTKTSLSLSDFPINKWIYCKGLLTFDANTYSTGSGTPPPTQNTTKYLTFRPGTIFMIISKTDSTTSKSLSIKYYYGGTSTSADTALTSTSIQCDAFSYANNRSMKLTPKLFGVVEVYN